MSKHRPEHIGIIPDGNRRWAKSAWDGKAGWVCLWTGAGTFAAAKSKRKRDKRDHILWIYRG